MHPFVETRFIASRKGAIKKAEINEHGFFSQKETRIKMLKKNKFSILVTTVLLSGCVAKVGAELPPNIIFIFADDVSAHELSAYGGPIHMPVLNQMAGEGIRFNHAWASPLCGPSRAMLHTGKYPHNQGYWENQVMPSVSFWQDQRHVLWLQMARLAGYKTGFFDKLHHGGGSHDRDQLDRQMQAYGADQYLMNRYWDGYDGPDQGRGGSERRGMYGVSWFYHPGMIFNGEPLPTNPDDFGPDISVAKIKDFIRANREEPFFVYWPTNLPHKAFDPEKDTWYYTDVPEVDANGNRTGNRIPGSLESTMQHLDLLTGEIIDELKKLGLLERTILFFVGDNGTADQDKGLFDRDRALHVPWVVYGGPVPSVGPSDVLVSLVDMWPTVADLTGYGGEKNTDGYSFAPYLTGKSFVPRENVMMAMDNARWIRDNNWLIDGYGRFWNVSGVRWYDDYIDVTESTDPSVMAARKHLQKIMEEELPLPNYEDPLTKASWQQFRNRKPPVKVYRPDYVE